MKRIFDFIASFISLIFFLPIIIIISIIIKVTSKGPIFFKQKRIGKNNKEFTIIKFRTMKIDTPDIATHLLNNAEVFITPIGKFLRKTSLDEIPQLINILKGEMSLVGPRPALYNQYDLIKLRTSLGIHELSPGLTGLAQISGRDELKIPEKVKLDEKYKKNQSFILDLKIIFLTVFKVLKSDGINEGANK